MDASSFTGSDFLKAADLGQTTPQITIAKVESVNFGDDTSKLVLHPADPAVKPVVLNVTNTRACVAAWGTETDAWLGKLVMLSVRQTQMGPGLGVTPLSQPAASATSIPVPDLPAKPGVPFDDKIPY